jgi:hypothetical protein
MLMIILAAAAVGAATPEPSAETPPKPVSSVTVEAKKKAEDKVVCYTEAATGSHRTTKVCRKKGEMETQDNLLRDRIHDRPQADLGGIGGGPR